MNNDPIDHLLSVLARRLRDDAELRAALRSAFRALTDDTPADPPRRVDASPTEAVIMPATPVVPSPTAVVRPAPIVGPKLSAAAAAQDITFARPPASPPMSVPGGFDAPPAFDLALFAARFDLKRDGCVWHVERRQLLQQPDTDFDSSVRPRDKEIMDRARALPGGCWMWMCQPTSPTPEPRLMDWCTHAYDNLAAATLLIRDVLDNDKLADREEENAMVLLAEAMSATRVALEQVDAPIDRDHKQLFEWLRARTSERGIFIARYMKIDDPADPADWNGLAERLATVRDRLRDTDAREQQHKRLLGTVRYHCQKLPDSAPDERANHWAKIITATTQLVEAGVPPSNTQLRDVLTAVVDSLPGEQASTPQFDQVLASIDVYLASRGPEPDADETAAPTPEVQRVRTALAGRSILLIGGEARPLARDRLKAAFDLVECYWPDTRVHESHYNFESLIHRDDVVVVLLAIRWSGHAFGEVKAFCDAAGKPLVRLPAGYHPNSVAKEILTQAGQRLGLLE